MTYSVVENSFSTIWFCESNHCGAIKVKGINISNCSFSLDSKQSEISVELLLLECALKVLSARTKGTKNKKCLRFYKLWWTTNRMCSGRVVGVPKKTKSTKRVQI